MAHRLFRTLVFSSSLLLEGAAASGCAESHATPDPEPDVSVPRADTGPIDAGGRDGGARVDAGRDSGPAADPDAGTDAPSQPDAPDAAVIEGDAGIFCEVGWPTTKAQTCEVDPSGITWCCRPGFGEDTGVPDCCIARPEDHF